MVVKYQQTEWIDRCKLVIIVWLSVKWVELHFWLSLRQCTQNLIASKVLHKVCGIFWRYLVVRGNFLFGPLPCCIGRSLVEDLQHLLGS